MSSWPIHGARTARRCLAILAAGALLLALPSPGEDWPRWRGPDLNGISRETNWTVDWPQEGPKTLWKASVGTGFSSVAVSQARLYTLGNHDETDTVYCFDAASGALIWKHEYPCPADPQYYEGGPGSTPTVDGNRVYTLSKRGQLFCFDAASGRVLWKRNLIEELSVPKPRWGFAGSPLVEGGLLVLNVGEAGTALDKLTGETVWSSEPAPAGYATPIPFLSAGARQVAIFSSKALMAVRVNDGRELWRHPWTTKWDINAADPIVSGSRVFLSSFDRGAALLELKTGEPKIVWENRTMANHFNSCILLDGHLYGVHGNSDHPDRDLRCIDFETGELKWTYQGLGLGSLMAAAGQLIVLSDRGELVVAPASPVKFEPVARAHVLGGKCWTPPVLANGRIYCRNARGALICLEVRAEAR
jgi:outer membrane protein assembly factor BamB